MRYYERNPDGSARLIEREGTGRFMLVSGELLRDIDPDNTGRLNLCGEQFRVIQQYVGEEGYHDKVWVMKESIVAHLFAWWHRSAVEVILGWVFRLARLFGMKDGEVFPWWTGVPVLNSLILRER